MFEWRLVDRQFDMHMKSEKILVKNVIKSLRKTRTINQSMKNAYAYCLNCWQSVSWGHEAYTVVVSYLYKKAHQLIYN